MRPFLLCLAIATMAGALASSTNAADAAGDSVALDARIDAFVAQLGAGDFALRQRAQAELERIGLSAFDALHAAQTHIDPEIALRARYLINSMRIEWSQSDDPPEVRRLFREYEQRSDEERFSKAEILLRIDDGKGLRSFGRIVCFEPDDVFSKRVALLLLRQDDPEPAEKRIDHAKNLRAAAGRSRREAADWLRAYADTLEKPTDSLATWRTIVKNELEVLQQRPEKTSKLLVRELLTFQAALLLKHGHGPDAVGVIKQSLDLIEGQRGELLEVLHWAIDHKAWSVVEEVERRFQPQVRADARLLYCLAEAQHYRKEAAANDTAAEAFKLSGEELDERIRMGMGLQDRGMFDWAEKEFREVSKISPVGQPYDWQARLQLAEMLHDQSKDLAAGDAMKPAVEAMDRDPNVLRFIEEVLGRDAGSIRSRMFYFYSQHALAQGDPKQQQEHLEKAFGNDAHDADVLIAMYRMPNATDEWKKKARERVNEAADHFRTEMDQLSRTARESEDEGPGILGTSRLLAASCNQFAWLVANTEGDADEAIKASWRSLEIRPNTGGYYDTLSHAYFAKRDFANAVKYQQLAAKFEPHSIQIRNQLDVFRAALEKHRGEINK